MKNQRQNNKKLLRTITNRNIQAEQAAVVILKPAGYPLRIAGEETISPGNVVTDNPKLFSEYCRSQWGGLIVQKGDFLFDSMIFPDFAFRIVKIHPNPAEIGPKTHIQLEIDKQAVFEAVKPRVSVQFSDIIGQEDAKSKMRVIKTFLSDPKLINSPWAPRNILFYGPPGTGKTMMARALASTVNISLLSIKASELIGIYVGEGSKKIQNLYLQAQKVAPCIVFIDELDAIALKRNYQSVRGDVVEIVSSLLGELDGFHENDGIVTIAATNLVSEIDPAILSRFEEVIEFKLPTQQERVQILSQKAVTSPVPFNVNWERVANTTSTWSGRDLIQRLLKPAIHNALLYDKKEIIWEDIELLIKRTMAEEKPKHYV